MSFNGHCVPIVWFAIAHFVRCSFLPATGINGPAKSPSVETVGLNEGKHLMVAAEPSIVKVP